MKEGIKRYKNKLKKRELVQETGQIVEQIQSNMQFACVWQAALSDVQCLMLCSVQNNSRGSWKQLLVFLFEQAWGPQGAHWNKALLSTASYTSTPAAHKRPLWAKQSLESQKRSCSTRKQAMWGYRVSFLLAKSQMWLSFML